jgi:hypothetical protein
MDATLILIDSDAERAPAHSSIGSGTRVLQPTSRGWKRKRFDCRL